MSSIKDAGDFLQTWIAALSALESELAKVEAQ
jgi:hypothetical protein